MEDLFSATETETATTQEDKLRIRCSQLGLLMTPPKGKSNIDKYNDAVESLEIAEAKYGSIVNKETKTAIKLSDKISALKIEVVELNKIKNVEQLSETAKKLIQSIWLFNKYGYKEDVITDDILKGLLVEQDSMGLAQSVLGGEFRVKNDEIKSNDWIIGCADTPLKKEDFIEDLKSNSNLRTYFEASYKRCDRYWWQAQGYMWLWNKGNYRLIYCLVPTPEHQITSQKMKFYYKFNCDETNEDYIKISMQVEHNNNLIKDIPERERVKVFTFPFEPEIIEMVKLKYKLALEYYNSLKL